jgi:hypothetical protein
MLAGLRRPAILIPAAAARMLDAQRLGLIGLHELAHLRRGDNLRRPLEEALLGLFWMTPPLALVRSRMAAATEEACDSRALRNAEPSVRKLYAQALIDTLRLGAGPEHAPAFIGAGRRSRLMRMNAILNPARPARPLTLALLGVSGAALIAAAGFGAESAAAQAAAAQPDPAPAPKTVTIISDAPVKSPDGKTETLTVNVDGDVVDAKGTRMHLKGKPVTLTVDARDSSLDDAKVMKITGVVDMDGPASGKLKIDGTIDPHGKGVYVITSDGRDGKSYTIRRDDGDKQDFLLKPADDGAKTFTLSRTDGKDIAFGAPKADSRSHWRGKPASPDGGSVDVEADRVNVDKDSGITVWSGNPQITVVHGKDADAAAIAYEVNGRPASADFDPSTYAPGQLDRIEVRQGAPGVTVNLITKTPTG